MTEIVVECPGCGTVYYDWYRPSINASLDPAMAADAEYIERATSATCPRCAHRADLTALLVQGDVWQTIEGVRARGPGDLVVACADVGSVAAGRFGWANEPVARDLAPADYHEPERLVDAVGAALASGRPVALGFECPMSVPVPKDSIALGRARDGEGNRPWSAGAGAGSLATGLVQTAWVLREIRERLPSEQLHLDWPSFAAGGRGLFIWEAFVTAEAKAKLKNPLGPHTADAQIAVRAFRRAISGGLPQTDVSVDQPLSIAGAAALWSGWLDGGRGVLTSPVLVVKATAEDVPR